MDKTNLNIQANVGLQNDWGIFNLNGVPGSINAYTNVYVEVITDGSKYVDNTDATIRHAATSPYKELQSILPVVTDANGGITWNVDNVYGKGLKQILNGYYPIGTVVENGDLWEGIDTYKNYANTFEVTFESNTGTYGTDITDKYFDYKSNAISFASKSYIKKTLNDIVGSKYIQANVDLLHFSKYYNIYTYSPNPIPNLRPLIHNVESFDKYGLGLDRSNNPFVRHMLMFSLESDDSYEEGGFFHTTYREQDNKYRTDHEVTDWRNGMYIKNGMTMFKSTPDTGSPPIQRDREESFQSFMPEGFSVLGVWDRWPVIGQMGSSWDNDDKTVPADYLKNFDTTNGNTKYNWECIGGNETYRKVRLTLLYFSDQQQNYRIFNNYFYVNANGKDIRQDIAYKSTATYRPATIGLAVASVLANIYVYAQGTSSDIPYISDCIYLNPNQTLYTKDIIYKAYVSKNTDNTDMLIFKGVKFRDYLDRVKQLAQMSRVKVNSTDTYNSSDRNIIPNIDGCIKNIPLQLSINYLEPNIESVGQADAMTRVFRIDGTHKDIYGWVPDEKELYQLDLMEDGTYKANTLNKTFLIRYLKNYSFKKDDDDNITADFDETIPPEQNSELKNIFKYDGEQLTFVKTKASGSVNDYYTYQTREYHGGALWAGSYYTYATLKYIPKKDVLIPHAKMIR